MLSAELTGSAAHVGHEDTEGNKGRKGQDSVGVFSKHGVLVLWLLCVGCPESGFVRTNQTTGHTDPPLPYLFVFSSFGVLVISRGHAEGHVLILSQCDGHLPLRWHMTTVRLVPEIRKLLKSS